jgi:hypothetical protein
METRRTMLKYLTGTMGASACGFNTLESFAGQLNGDTRRPNIVCIVGEGLRWDEMSSAGNKLLHTPNLDRIGREGCTFKNAFVVNALCLPSRATMLTGMYSHTTPTWKAESRRVSRWFLTCCKNLDMKRHSWGSPTSRAR